MRQQQSCLFVPSVSRKAAAEAGVALKILPDQITSHWHWSCIAVCQALSLRAINCSLYDTATLCAWLFGALTCQTKSCACKKWHRFWVINAGKQQDQSLKVLTKRGYYGTILGGSAGMNLLSTFMRWLTLLGLSTLNNATNPAATLLISSSYSPEQTCIHAQGVHMLLKHYQVLIGSHFLLCNVDVPWYCALGEVCRKSVLECKLLKHTE